MDFFRTMVRAAQHGFARLIIDQPARWLGMDRLIYRLEASGQKLEQRAARLQGRSANQKILTHIVGIERWGLRRMRAALGEMVMEEDSEVYYPAAQNWQELIASLRAARQATIALSKTLRMAGVDPSTRVKHNQFGDITLLGWLFYLDMHASMESMRLS